MNREQKNGVALISGASSGIGATYADRLARRGYDLVLVARDQQRLDDLAARLVRDTEARAEVLRADLTSKSDLARVEQRLRDDDRITMLVNNAGIAASGPFVGADLDSLEKLILLNTVAVMRLAGAAVPGFVARGRGTVINIASVTALTPETFNGTYSGTKAFVLNFTQALQAEVGERGVRVQAVLPGGTRTDLWERSGYDLSRLPLERFMGVEEMVDAALAGLDQGGARHDPVAAGRRRLGSVHRRAARSRAKPLAGPSGRALPAGRTLGRVSRARRSAAAAKFGQTRGASLH